MDPPPGGLKRTSRGPSCLTGSLKILYHVIKGGMFTFIARIVLLALYSFCNSGHLDAPLRYWQIDNTDVKVDQVVN